ncbi:MAG: hypothetical protein ACP5RI_01200 [Candidatus Micrarchaeia archaeon]
MLKRKESSAIICDVLNPKVTRLKSIGAEHPHPEIILPNSVVKVLISPELLLEYEKPEFAIIYIDIVRSMDALIIKEYKRRGDIVINRNIEFCIETIS